MNPITIVFAGINDHLFSRSFLSKLREPTTADDAVWSAIEYILESMGETMDVLKEGAFPKITPKAVFALVLGLEVLELELSNFSRQLKLKPGSNDDHRVMVEMSNDNKKKERRNRTPKRRKLTWKQWFCTRSQSSTGGCT